jgi:hypothetical protein
MHFFARDLLAEDDPAAEFSKDLVTRVIRTAREAGLNDSSKFQVQVPVGNLLGIVGYSRRAIRPVVFALLLKEYLGRSREDIPRLVELVALQTLGYRATSGVAQDAGLKEKYLQALMEGYGPGRSEPEPASPLILQTAVWWVEALAGEEYSRTLLANEISVQGLFEDAAAFVSHVNSEGDVTTHILDETMQRVLLNLQVEMLSNPSQVFNYITYLVTLVAADRSGVLVPDVRAGLRRVLGEGELGTKLNEVVEHHCRVPGAIHVWQECRAMYKGALDVI